MPSKEPLLQIDQLEIAAALNIYTNMRVDDKAEADAANFTADHLPSHCVKGNYSFSIDGDPVAMFGSFDWGQTISAWFFAKDRIAEVGSVFSRVARQYVRQLAAEHIATPIVVFIFDQSQRNLRWLMDMGFEATGYQVGPKDARFLVLQFRG